MNFRSLSESMKVPLVIVRSAEKVVPVADFLIDLLLG
jgi:hypothetical protein